MPREPQDGRCRGISALIFLRCKARWFRAQKKRIFRLVLLTTRVLHQSYEACATQVNLTLA